MIGGGGCGGFRKRSNPLPVSLPPSCEATAAAAASTGAPPGELTKAQTAREPAAAMRRAGEEEEEDEDDEAGDESTATAAAAVADAAAALIALDDCCCPPASETAARTTAGLLLILFIDRLKEKGTGGRWASRRATPSPRDDSELVLEEERMPVAGVDLAGNILCSCALSRVYYVLSVRLGAVATAKILSQSVREEQKRECFSRLPSNSKRERGCCDPSPERRK